jgi:RNA recognition motif-containing protein
MSFTVFLGNLPVWVTADDIRSWLTAEGLVSDAVKVIRNPETQESKGFAFIDAPNAEEMNSIIRRFDRAPLEDRLLRANPAQPPKSKSSPKAADAPRGPQQQAQNVPAATVNGGNNAAFDRNRRGGKKHKRPQGPQSAFAEELAKAL